MVKISAVVITKNEESNIERALQSLSFVDDIVVFDSGSTDKTVEIAQKYATVHFHEFDSYGKQKNRAVEKTKNDWVVLLDADEEITAGLAGEIQQKAQNSSDFKAFTVRRVNYLMGARMKYGGLGNDKIIRLIHKKYCKYDDALVHETIKVNGKTGHIDEVLNHFTYSDFSDLVLKINHYSTLRAKENKGKKVKSIHFVIKPFFRFVKQYVLKKGFLDGRKGFVMASISGISVFLRYVKIWRLQKGENF